LREALGDNAEQPKFIETIPKRGYRFIGTIEPATSGAAPVAAAAAASRVRRSPNRFLLVALGAVLMLIATLLFWFNLRHPLTIAVVRFHNETGNPQLDRLANDLTDAVVISLASNTEYSVIGNSPILRTDRIFEDVGKIGAELNATFVVLGQLQTGDTGLVARAHFIRTADAKHLWADKIDLGDPSGREERLTTLIQNGVTVGLARNK
jgi:TolB-like protein